MQNSENIILKGWRRLSLAMKFTSLQIIVASVLLAIFLYIFHNISVYYSDKQLNERLEQTNAIVNNFLTDKIEDDTANLLSILKMEISTRYGEIRETSFKTEGNTELVTEQKMQVPNLTFNNIQLANNFDFIDTFRKLTDAEATIFAKEQNNDFTRITTSLKDSNNKRLIGTKINASHPAHAIVLKGENFYGRVTLFGNDYVSIYEPIMDSNKQVIGIFFVAFQIEKIYNLINASLKNIQIGSSGNGGILVFDKQKNHFILGGGGQTPYKIII